MNNNNNESEWNKSIFLYYILIFMYSWFYRYIFNLKKNYMTCSFYWFVTRYILWGLPVLYHIFALCFGFFKILLVELGEYGWKALLYPELPDWGTYTALDIMLEHMYVSYYLIIIMIFVPWLLYIFVLDFFSPEITSKPLWVSIRFFIIKLIVVPFNCIYFYFYLFILRLHVFREQLERDAIKEDLFNLNKSIISNIVLKLNSFKTNKYLFFILKEFTLNEDILGRTLISKDIETTRIFLKANIIESLIKVTQENLESSEIRKEIFVRKNLVKFLFNRVPKAYFFQNINALGWLKGKIRASNLNDNFAISSLRVFANDLIETNNFKHSNIYEAIWVLIPSFIIISILIPSLILLYSFEDASDPDLCVEVQGNQWYWTYQFNNWVNIWDTVKEAKVVEDISSYTPVSYAFNSKMITTKTLEFGTKRLLDVDNRLVLPTDTMIKTLVTSVDVLHAFAVPQLGFKVDAVPGRLNQILLYINRVGVYYGQCSELCGIGHGFMPIVIDAYTPDVFFKYLKEFKKED